MALGKCPECSRDVSDQATACPHCGHPLRVQPPQSPPSEPRVQQTQISHKPGSSVARGIGGGFGGCLGVLLAIIVIIIIISQAG